MSADEFQGIARLIAGSAAGRAAVRLAAILRAAAAASLVSAWLDRLRDRWDAAPAATRVCGAGIVLLTGTVMQAALLAFLPSLVRPAAPRLLRVEALVLASVLIVLATPLACAWETSRTRRWIQALITGWR